MKCDHIKQLIKLTSDNIKRHSMLIQLFSNINTQAYQRESENKQQLSLIGFTPEGNPIKEI